MEGKTIGLGIAVICIIVAGILILLSNGGLSPVAMERSTGMMDADRMFIEQMIPHHQDAVEMGELALVKAEHPEIKQLAANIIRDQSREISQMRSWYREWYGIEVPVNLTLKAGGMGMMGGGSMSGGGMGGTMTDLQKLGNATSFDKEFIEQMIPHHRMAIMMARMVVQHSDRAEIRELGTSIIRSQSAEVDMMQAWYRDWYGREFDVSTSMGVGMH
jgi:uncharacterized protein (DUF305 family)